MKDFSESAILTSLVAKLQTYDDWAQVVSDGSTISLLGSFAESESEIVRYLEYLFYEVKWGHARNRSSLMSPSQFLSYVASRKISSLSTLGLVVSHDPALQSAGISNIFSISDLNTYLSPYLPTSTTPDYFNIQIGDMFSTSSGVNFFATQSVPYLLSTDSIGSTGTKYVVVPIMQGIRKSVVKTILGNPSEEILIESSNVESANNPISKEFFVVSGQVSGSSDTISFKKYDSIFEASYNEYAYEVETTEDFSSIIIRFGNGVAGKIPPSNCLITISYVETLGSLGNIETNYVVNTVVKTSLGSTLKLYCSNIPESGSVASTILGGSEEDGVETIRARAPKAYLTGGSIITTDNYKYAIMKPSIPYIQNATVYSGVEDDPATGNQRSVINYSAIQVDGTAPSETEFPVVVEEVIGSRNSPLDTISYVPPKFVHLKYNLWAVPPANTNNPSELVTSIKSDIYNTLAIGTQSFKGSFLKSSMDASLQNKYLLKDVSSMIESVVDLVPSEFSVDPVTPQYYYKSFYFDRSFKRLNNFNDKTLHCLKVNIFFDCADCTYGGTSFSRTIFLVNDVSETPSYTVKFGAGTTAGNITVCGSSVSLDSTQVASPSLIVSRILTLTLSNYTMSSPSPGVLVIVPANASVAPPSIAVGSTGVTFTKEATVQYKSVQYPFIDKITNYDYMSKYVLNQALSPDEILPNDVTTPYVPITVELDYNSLNPTDLDSTNLGQGVIRIPLYLFGSNSSSSLTYINFAGANPVELDSKISIQIIGQVFDSKVECHLENNIIQVNNNSVTEDILVEIV